LFLGGLLFVSLNLSHVSFISHKHTSFASVKV
jgi:hypothetical protein